MKFISKLIYTFLIFSPATGWSAMEDPLILQIKADEFETADNNSQVLGWDAQAWLGSPLKKLWLKAEGERKDSDTEEFEVQALYSTAVSTYWDFQAGIRHDFEPSPQNSWAVIGFQGLAPYFFEVESAVFLSEEGDLALRMKAEYELLFTQRLILTPEIEMNFYQDDIPEMAIGSGLADISAGLRLRYEIRRKFAPYIGISWREKFSGTADYASLAGEETSEANVVAGLRFWF